MSKTESIKWVVCPNGIDSTGQNLQVGVFAGVTLSGGPTGTLADFPDFQNWPTRLLTATGLEFVFSFDVGGSTVATYAATINPATTSLSEQLWTNLFPTTTVYNEQAVSELPSAELPVISYPTSQLVSFITSQYNTLPTVQVPTHAQVAEVFNNIRPTLVGVSDDQVALGGLESYSQIQSRLAAQRLTPDASGRVAYANDFSDVTSAEAFAAHAQFFTPNPSPPAPGFSPSAIDFHAAQTFIGEHRWLQRALGFAFDFEIPITSLAALGLSLGSSVSDVYVSVTVGVRSQFIGNTASATGGDAAPALDSPIGAGSFTPIGTPVSPQTRCSASTTVFEPYSATAADTNVLPVSGGLLPVGDETRFSVHTINVELGAARATSFSSAVQTALAPGTVSTVAPRVNAVPNGENFSPPQVLSGSLTLTLTNRGVLFVSELSRQTSLAQGFADPNFEPSAQPLQASDLVRGLILDVYDTTTGTWYSTNRRLVTYSSPATNPTVTYTGEDDEGGTQAPPMLTNTSDGGGSAAPAYAVSETVLTYNGWSNAVPLPGNQTEDSDSALGTAGGPFGEEISITLAPVPGSLPLLRFGRTYYLRARAVDIAGNVVPLGLDTPIDNGEDVVNGPILYARYEGVNPPDVYALQNSGNSYPVPGESAGRVVIRDIDIAAAGGSFSSHRLLAPPRTTVPFAERHGLFDSGGTFDPKVGTSASWYDVITATNPWGQPRESGQYLPSSGQIIPLLPSGASGSATLQSLAVPYLPDPLAKGGVITINPLGPMEPGTVTFDFLPSAGWPAYQPVQLTLEPSSGGRAASYSAAQRTVTFSIDAADTVPLTVACTFDAADVATYALGQLVPGVDPTLAAQGLYWAITPPRDLTLVYAVKQPLIAPELSIPTPPRSPGDTFVLLAGTCNYSPKSTSTIDVVASWSEPIDIPGSAYAGDEDASIRRGHAVETPITPISPIEPVTEPSLGATQNSVLQGPGAPNSALATTSNVQVFKAPSLSTAGASGGTNMAVEGFESAGDIALYSVTDSFTNGRHEFHDTKFRQVTYSAIATTAFTSDYEVGKDVADASDLTLASTTPVTVDILSSARPTGLTIPYVVPIYDWESVTTDATTGEVTTGRQPSALRVFIERPWWSSGIDELLGVVTWPNAEPTFGPSQSSSTDQPQVRRGNSKSASKAAARRASERVSKHASELASKHASVQASKHAAKPAAGKSASPSAAIGGTSAVVITPLPVAENPPPQEPISEPTTLYVSDWGSDPLFAGGALPTPHPNLETFTNAVAFGQGLSIEEHSGITVNAAGHEVQYDSLRDLWYADVAVDFGSAYTPMIRLALARFQPNSISGVELGRITQVDIMSLEPGRSVSVVPYEASGQVYLNVALSGVSYTSVAGINRVQGGTDAAPGIAQVMLEQRDTSVSDEDLGWTAVTDPVTMDATTSGGITTWVAKAIPIPSGDGQFRLYLNQYEVFPSETRPALSDQFPQASTPPRLQVRHGRRAAEQAAKRHDRDARSAGRRRPRTATGSEPPAGYRLLYQDMIPVSNHLPRQATRLGTAKLGGKSTKAREESTKAREESAKSSGGERKR